MAHSGWSKTIILDRKDIPLRQYVASRIVSIREIIAGIKNPVVPNNSLGAILFNARYNAGKAIEGYDFY